MSAMPFGVAVLVALCLVASSAGVVVGQQTTTPPAPDAWTPVIEEVVSRLSVNIPGAVVQVLTLPMPANWNDPRLGNHYLWEVLANQIPEWGMSSEPSRTYWSSRRRVTDEYRFFVTSLALPLPDKGAQKQALKARDKYLKALQKIDNVTKDRRSWQNGQLTTRAQRQIDDLRHEASTQATRYAAFLNQAHQGFGAAGDLLIDLDNPAYQRPALSPDGLTLTYRTFSVSPDLTGWIAAAQPRPQTTFATVTVNSVPSPRIAPGQFKPVDAVTRDPATGELVIDPRSMGRSWRLTTGRNDTVLDSGTVSSLELQGRHIGIFTISPGRWFNGSALSFFRNGPWVDGPLRTGQLKLWGSSGAFALIPAAFVVVYEPTVTFRARPGMLVDLDASFRKALTENSVSIGPFTFGGTTSRLTADAPSGRVSVTDLSRQPQIVAVISTILPAGSGL